MNDREWDEHRGNQDEGCWAQAQEEDEEARRKKTTASGSQSSNSSGATDWVVNAIARALKWLVFGPSFVAFYLVVSLVKRFVPQRCLPGWIFRWHFLEVMFGCVVAIAAIAFSAWTYYFLAFHFGDRISSVLGPHRDIWKTLCVMAIPLHFVMQIWRRTRHTVWIGAPMLGSFAWGLWGVLDSLRNPALRGDLVTSALVAAGAIGMWLLLRPPYMLFSDIDGQEAATTKRQTELAAAIEALVHDQQEGKDGEARVHAALEAALRRQFGREWALLPAGGLLPIQGRIPFTDIDHIVVTPHCIIAIETKDWAWKEIGPVAGDDSLIERSRKGQVERFKNPYQQAAMKPKHLRNSLDLDLTIPIEFAVCFANPDNVLNRKLPVNMIGINDLRAGFKRLATQYAGTRMLPVSDLAHRIRRRLDYSPQAYERFRSAMDSDGSYGRLLARRDAAVKTVAADAPDESSGADHRPGVMPRWMLNFSLGVLVLAVILTDTGHVAAAVADGLSGPVLASFGWVQERSVDAPPALPISTAPSQRPTAMAHASGGALQSQRKHSGK